MKVGLRDDITSKEAQVFADQTDCQYYEIDISNQDRSLNIVHTLAREVISNAEQASI